MNREMQYRERVLEVENKQEMILNDLVRMWKEKFGSGDDRLLKVYIDLENKKYYITVFAALSLGFLSYKEASNKNARGEILYEITPQILQELKRIFNDRIIYEYLPYKNISKNNIFIDSEKDNTNKDNLKTIKKELLEQKNILDSYYDDNKIIK